ncbi:hypothetical protein HK100_006985 [Physocladia obscura]|uniref:Major facilitator superfamily (MFS) profile domain-containing protein n=1 Tax=Physocladia obscura TaxID=109957 RepID=A0AAD5T7F4_9FUNG|nr:hypothetical protein HK100_006985 [Physocladia obscura]
MTEDLEMQTPKSAAVPNEFSTDAVPDTPNTSPNTTEAAAIKPPEPDNKTGVKVPLNRIEFALVYVGLLLAILLFALDQTIVTTALRVIVQDLGQEDLISWIGSAFLLTAAPFSTLYGKLADIFGRKWVFVSAIGIFELGSLICGSATSMPILIAGRAIAGVGGGGVFALVLIIISDIVSLRDRGKYTGPFGAITGLASVVGPLIGGGLSDLQGSMREKINRIDFIGAALLMSAVICFLTPLQLGGSIWAWNSGQTIGMLVGSAIFLALFIFVELKIANEPIIPAKIFINRSVPLLLVISMMFGAGFLAGIYYISLFFQIVFDETATQGGLAIVPALFGIILVSFSSGIIASKTGKYVIFLRIGPVVMAIGIALLSVFDKNTSVAVRIISLFVFGFGVGSLLQMINLALQNSVPRELIAIATGAIQTCNTLGRAIGVAITGTISNNVLIGNQAGAKELQYFISKFAAEGVSVDPTNTLAILEILQQSAAYYPNNTIAAEIYNATLANATEELIGGFNNGFKIAYLSLLPYPIAIFLLSWFVQHFDLGPSSK